MFDGEAFGAEIVGLVKGYLERELGAFSTRLGAIERRIEMLVERKHLDLKEGRELVKNELAPVYADMKALAEKIPDFGKMVDVAVAKKLDDERGHLEEYVRSVVAEIPPPEPVKADLDARFDELSKALKDEINAWPKPQDGKSVTPEDVRPMVAELVEKAVSAIPVPKDGKDADMKVVLAEIEKIGVNVLHKCMEVVESIPAPKDGTSVTVEDVRPLIEEQVRRAIAAIPVPKDGTSVTIDDVAPMIVGEIQKRFDAWPKPQDGKDGIGVMDALIDRDNCLVLTLSNGSTKNLGRIVGRDGKDGAPGAPGADGVGFDDLTFEYDGERTITLKFVKGEQVKDFSVKVPMMIYRGIFSESKEYEAGDCVTWGGSVWVAQRKTTAKPETNDDWKLAVKRGKDGGVKEIVKLVEPKKTDEGKGK